MKCLRQVRTAGLTAQAPCHQRVVHERRAPSYRSRNLNVRLQFVRSAQVLEPLLDDLPLDTAAVLRLHIATATCLNDLHCLMQSQSYASCLDYTHVCSLVSAISRTLDGCFIGQHERTAVSNILSHLHDLAICNVTRFSAEDVVALLEGYAQLQAVDSALLPEDATLLSALANKASASFVFFSGPQMARVLWALLQLNFLPSDGWRVQFFERSYYKLSELQAGDHAALMRALEAAHWEPPANWAKAWAFHAEVTHGFRAEEVCHILHAMATLSVPAKRTWCSIMVEKCEQDLPLLQPQQLVDLLWACANITGESHSFCPSARWMEDFLEVAMTAMLTSPALRRLQTMPGLLKPSPNLFSPAPPPPSYPLPPPSPTPPPSLPPAPFSLPSYPPSAHSTTYLQDFTLDTYNTMDKHDSVFDPITPFPLFSSLPPPSSLTHYGPSTPSPWFASPHPPSPTTASQLARLISSLAQLSYRPSHYWLAEFVLEVSYKLPCFEAEDLALLMWGLAMLEHRPDNDWLKQFGEEVQSKMDTMTPSQMSRIMWALSVFHYHIA